MKTYLITLEINADSPKDAVTRALAGVSADLLPDSHIAVTDPDLGLEYIVEGRRDESHRT